jgi:glycosyltransferase involved in cell wall biosynthesis
MLDYKKVIIRLHSYEVLQNVSGYIRDINWDRCDALICVAEHVRLEAINQIRSFTNLNKNFETYVIPNGVDMERFPLTEDGWDNGLVNKIKNRGKNVAYIGHIGDKKGPMLMLHAFEKLSHHTVVDDTGYPNPFLCLDHKLHVAGDFYDLRYLRYWEHMTKEMKLENNIILHGAVNDMPTFLKDMHYVVCSSPWESQNMSVMEAMATGCMPMVHNFPGAKDIYPEMFVWTTIDEFVDKILTMPWSPTTFRKIIQDKYDFKERIKDIEEAVHSLDTPMYGESFVVKG